MRTSSATNSIEHWGASRFESADSRGFYESYFLRANHPSRPLAFWIRYTVFSPKDQPHRATGELWAIYFDGENQSTTAVKESFPITQCAFSQSCLDVRIGPSSLNNDHLSGQATFNGRTIKWSLHCSGQEGPLLLLPKALYAGEFPKAKVLVLKPNARFSGELVVDGVTVAIDDWQGSQNHNWGSRHTDRYCWGQVAGFDNAPAVFLECATAQLKVGPVWSPQVSPLVLRTEDAEYALNRIIRGLRTTARVSFFRWEMDARESGVRIKGFIHASAGDFVGLRYANPPGGEKICLNTKIAAAEFTLFRRGHAPRSLSTRNRAAFEIVTDRGDHGVPVVT